MRYLKILISYFASIAILMMLSSCNKTEELNLLTINDYSPLQEGKYITYKLDSLNFIAFGTRDTIITNEVKYVVDEKINDNLGRPAYRIIRYIRKSSDKPWVPNDTYMAVNTGNSLEFIENNLRFIKLFMPVKEYNSWKGNSFIDTYSTYSTLKYLDNWDYTYSSVGIQEKIGDFTLNDIITVDQRDETIGNPSDPASYSEINFSQEKYAKGIGLVYRKFFHKEYQPGPPGYIADGSYGVTYTMIDHN
ncbi:MAG: hypothetical protein FGM46_08265 [Ferruginibacter sp.]|nr:hypothetical protein [Ferruginibacter sp.]